MLPGPTMRSALGTVRVPYANAAMACAPPISKTRVRPSIAAVPHTWSTGLGEATQMFATPATCAGTAVIRIVEGKG